MDTTSRPPVPGAAGSPPLGPPAPGSRQAAILDAVLQRGTARVADLAEEFGVSQVTVRRDVALLDRAGLLRRSHGGATAPAGARVLGNGVGGSPPRATGSVGTLVPSLDFYWPDVVRGAEEEAARLGMRMTLRGSIYHATDERSDINRLVESGAAGLLIAPTMHGRGGELIRAWLAQAPVPAVLMERTAEVGPARRSVESVVTDHAGGAAMAVHHLASLGHRRIGVALKKHSPHRDQIHTGWHAALADLELAGTRIAEATFPEQREPEFEPAIDALLDATAQTGTTALIVHSDPEAVRVAQRAEERGLDIPGELSIISYDDEVATLTTPALSAVRPPRGTIGRTAMGLLAARIADPDRPVHRVQVSPTLMVRDSCGPPPTR